MTLRSRLTWLLFMVIAIFFVTFFAYSVTSVSNTQPPLYGYAVVALVCVIFFSFGIHTLLVRPLEGIATALLTRKADLLQEALNAPKEVANIARATEEFFRQSALLDQYKNAIDEALIVSKTDTRGIITHVNDAFCRLSGYSAAELIGKNHNIVRHPNTPPETFRELWETIKCGQTWRGVITSRSKSGKEFTVDTTILPLRLENGEIGEYIAIRSDIIPLMDQWKIIQEQSTDQLTGLPNRQKLLRDLNAPVPHVMCMLNIDRFREINETYGFEFGDRTLAQIGQTLRNLIPVEVSLYRLNGDQFALLHSMPDEKLNMANLANALIAFFATHDIIVDDTALEIAIRISMARDSSNLIMAAEFAQSCAREMGKSFVDYNTDPGVQQLIARSAEATAILKYAMETNGIQVFGQKILSLAEPDKLKVECLMRIEGPNNVLHSPFNLLEHAKKARTYDRFSQMMIRKLFAFLETITEGEFSLNLSSEDIQDEETMSLLYALLAKHYGRKTTLVFEIVESTQIRFTSQLFAFVETVRGLGCKIAIDDFGSGYSNFDTIIKLRPDYLKIDGSLVRHIDHDDRSEATVRTIVAFAKQLNIEVVAEFVHSEAVLEKGLAMGIDYFQGFHLHQPEPIAKCVGNT
ncbi:EAL domain-containing protein [Chrysiogenes arsenatis]|uniref:EAL domain-containing protein n=1 Tax=Chrysiogenes arsenatis TaxID=309797 RepID=UPI000426FB0D|nr:EAL domain-containing protein [Chrysiogenes arsenatis]